MVKFFLSFSLLLSLQLSSHAWAASGIEEQRKYNFGTDHPFTDKEFSVGFFSFLPHSVYKTDDIYFDSDDGDVKKNGLSFRLRRVEKSAGKQEYAIQLKSELTKPGETRMELEYKDFSLQKVGSQKLTTLINSFIDNPEQRTTLAKNLTQWLQRKKTSSLAPFQKLRELQLDPRSLSPKALGHSDRLRFHIFTDRTTNLAVQIRLKNSKKNEFKVPEYFKTHPEAIWLMEASFDSSRFYNLTGKGPADIQLLELEIENKYRPRKVGTHLMNTLETLLIEKRNAKTGMASKYLQAVSFFSKE